MLEELDSLQPKLSSSELKSKIQKLTGKKKLHKEKLNPKEKLELDRLIRIKASRDYRMKQKQKKKQYFQQECRD